MATLTPLHADDRGGKIVALSTIAKFMGADSEKTRIAFRRLAAARAAVETASGEWVLISPMPTPVIKRGKVLTMPKPLRKAEPSSTDSTRPASAIDHQTNAYQHQDAGDDGRAPW
jgi:hypothetical protein